MRESILPRMYTATQDTVLGGVIQHVNSKKMVIVLGEPGEGKTVTMLDFCTQYPHPAYYYRCSPNTTMNSLLVFIANAIGVRVVAITVLCRIASKESFRMIPTIVLYPPRRLSGPRPDCTRTCTNSDEYPCR